MPPGDEAALAAAIDRLLSDPAAREQLSAGARKLAAGDWSWSAVATSHLRAYRELIG